MSEKKVVKPVALAVGAALAGSFALGSSIANAETVVSPFAMSTMSAGYMLDSHEGSCGGDKEDKGEGACGEGSCGGDKEDKGEGACGADEKEGEGSCGEGSCGSDTG
jgi:uncharacterized low-complexity protein